ncbi:unnamed protein product [Larinioides sclopetarius]|uniref:Uncharacterized protein n=1 Tax=Larinioides sclopetarius TaxID=280406 RepID=A0AAV2BEJ9_9ARAC
MFDEILERAVNLFQPNLEDMALSKVTVTLCKQAEIKTLIKACDYHKMIYKKFPYEEQKDWKLVQLKAVEKMSMVCIPEKLRKRVLDRVWHVSLEICKWIDYHTKNSYLGIEAPDDFCWTPQGKIDKRKTAETIIRNERIDIRKRYKLACLYCLEDDIRILWEKMRRTTRKAFYNGRDPKLVEQHGLVIYWTYFIQEVPLDHNVFEEHDELSNVCAFQCAALEGNKIATEYFYERLTDDEKKSNIVPCIEYLAMGPNPSTQTYINFPEQDLNDSVYFLFSRLDEEDRFKVFESYPLLVLKSFLSWPRQKVFMELVGLTWQYLPEKDFGILLLEILSKDLDGYKDYNYRELFLEFWDTSPPSYKRFINSETSFGGILLVLLIRYKIPFISRKKSFQRKVKFINSILKDGTTKERFLVDDEKWEFLKFIIQEGIATKRSMTHFETQFFTSCTEVYSARKSKWDQCFKLIHMILPAEKAEE